MTPAEYLRALESIRRLGRELGYTRTASDPAGEVMELVTAHAFDGELAPPSTKSIDVVAANGDRIQVKTAMRRNYNNVRFSKAYYYGADRLELDSFVFIILTNEGDVAEARQLSQDEYLMHARKNGDYTWIDYNGIRDVGLDITSLIREVANSYLLSR
ncbi:DUF6998 domain-containing protein [Aurantimicrobium minutum]|uniref:DUF6998 domain-containing protein n=1 Tax=Aurantimicrobium minutum TaxID=708131 RepID=A0A173LYE5_9MICO|nr:hypothetical protein [Aurantimicrobium minutum]BAU99985.1 Uncharacterized protein AUMI_114430 [Aurantimicrobium minutum]